MTTATANARVPVLMNETEKARLVSRASLAGMSTGEFMRRAAEVYRPEQEDQVLEGLIDQMMLATERAEQAIDDALAFVAESEQRIQALESAKDAA